MAATPDSQAIRRALDRAAWFFRDRESRGGVLARRLLGQMRPDDRTLAEHLVRALRRKTRMDGSVEGSLVRTAWVAWELLDLGCSVDHAAVVRTVGYVLAAQDGPGHFGEGCSRERHGRRLCHHFLRGLFSPGARDIAIAPLAVPSGAVMEAEEEARLAASCLALRVVLRAGEDRRAVVRQHVETLLQLPELWNTWNESWSSDLVFLALGALVLAPIEYRPRVEDYATHVLKQQDRDGGWQGSHLFNALDALWSAPPAVARTAAQQAAPLLCRLQQESGAFSKDNDEEQALIALRILQLAAS
ncbi:MAG: hypothetical protein GTN62_06190 [Gemmatimonadales bacterium]|nr:hypothetical protein [Gemmatimonadales bacterium]NIN11088.1 hypothetical protein [Gemmatimonadales bacterium]NIN49685.1 hypothetical protein [Gemmatimonadales bacterium]NIP07149.1 hypothetical protein [Gemmatimonadales bacterium]NIQ99540.1 hypothetical protein [Gemmatimonadales bacterium]